MRKTRLRGHAGVERRAWLSALATVVLAGCLSDDGTDNGETPEADDGATPTGSTDRPDEGSPTRTKTGHPSLESELYGLATADDPEGYADRHGIELSEKGVLVTIEFATVDADAPPEATVRHRSGAHAEAWVDVDDLLTVADYERVSFVRLVTRMEQSERGWVG